ncbi:MAG TPA: hypothetical protein ENJ80_10675 [Gammaproteobacteria bacterium]|nr:hypothetical protein [Gammaproteobacteria bacterium]
MKTAMLALLLLLPRLVAAHHTKDHRMLAEDSAEVIAATRHGAGGDWDWLLWTGLAALLALGIVRWWKARP